MKLLYFYIQLLSLSILGGFSSTVVAEKNPVTEGNLAFQIVSYDCNSGVLQYKFTGGDGSPITVSLPGIFAGTMNTDNVASYTFPGDGRVGRTVTGTASQSGNQISINFTNGCNLGPTPNPPTNPPTGTTLTKVRFYFRNDNCGVCRDRCAQSQIQGSTDNLGWTTLAVIPSLSDGWNEVATSTSTAWRYVRYQSAGGCYGELMELEFYNGSTRLNGTPFGSTSSNPSYNYTNAFDGNIATLWHGDAPGTQNFAGLDLGTSNPPPVGTCSVNSPNGTFDYADCNGVYGWALDQSNLNQPVTIDIYVDGVKTYTGITANGDRQDLVAAFGNPAARYHGFSYSLPANANWKDGQNHAISVRICGVNYDINGGPKVITCNSQGARPNGTQVGRILFPGDPNLNLNWDWTQPQYTIWYKSGGIKSEVVANPFNSDVPSTVTKGDQYQQDGWMLVARDFGISPDDAQRIGISANALVLPFFILYNKFTGKFRVFIYNPSERTEFTHHSVSLSLAGNNNNQQPALLAFGDSDSTRLFDNQYNTLLSQNTLTPAAPTGWSVADFDLSFFDYRIEYTSQYDDWSLIISIDDVTISKSISNGNLALNGTVQPKSTGVFTDAAKSVQDFGVKGIPEIKNLVSALTKGAEKGIEIAAGLSSGLSLITAASDLVDGLSGSSGAYDVSLTGTLSLSGITTTSVGGYSYAIPLKPRTPRPVENNYYPLQYIPWGIVGLSKFSTIDVRGLSFNEYHPACTTNERGYTVAVDCSDYHANGFSISPVLPSGLENRNGLRLTNIQAAYFNPDRTPTPHAFPFENARSSVVNGLYVPSDFEKKEFIVNGTQLPFTKVGILFTFQPVNPTIKITDPIIIYRVFSTSINIRYVNTSSIQGSARMGIDEYVLGKPYPNPFRSTINLPLTTLRAGSKYQVQIVSLNGKTVWEQEGVASEEVKSVQWSGQNSAGIDMVPGVYLSRIVQEGIEVSNHKIMLIR